MASSVLGREKELHAVGRFLDSLTEGPSACVFEGEAGIGKTALWREAVASARTASLRVLRCAPAEVEAAFSYSSLADLLEGVESDVFAALPAPQRDALEVALLRAGRADAVAGQRAVATGALSVLAHLASSSPVVVAIDDVQWLDGATARVLEFAARRLEGRPVGFLLSLRTPSSNSAPLGLDRSLADERLERVRVGALSAGALHQLIKARLGCTFSRAALLRIHSATEGNPFFALELASSLQDAGAPVAGEALPVSDDVRALVASGLRTLPAPTREMLLTAAAMTNPTVGVLRRAVRASSKQMLARLAGAEAARVLVVEGESVRFSHPLFASAIYAAASSDERREAHRRLAALAANTEERARHLALCTEEPDGAVASTVAEAAREVRRRGAPGSAVELAELAIRLTPADAFGEHDERALELAYYLVEAGDAERAREVLLTVAERPGPQHARALLDLAALDYWGEGSRPAVARCEQALAAAAAEPALVAACHAELAVYCDFDSDRCEQHARAALELLDAQGEAADPDALIDALLATTRASLLTGRGLPTDTIERAFDAESRAEQSIHRSRVGAQLAQWLKYVDDFDGSRARLEHALSQSVAVGDESSMPNELMHLAQLECWSGNWPLASRYAAESVELAEQSGQSFGGPPAMRALIDAHLGNVEEARSVERHLAGAEGTPLAVPLHRALGFLQLSLGDPAGAEFHLSRTLEIAESFGIREPAVYRVHADLIEALIATGELSRAEAVLNDLEQRAKATRIPWSLATGARCRGLLLTAHGELDAAERSLESALRKHDQLPMPFERGRTLLVLGLLQRRRNERRRAHESLDASARDLRAARRTALGSKDTARAPSPGRAPDEQRGPDAGRTASRGAGSQRTNEPSGSGRPVHQPEDGRVEPRARLPEAGHPLARRARRARRRLRPPEQT